MIIGLLLSLLNVGMVVAPIGGAVGVLAGIDYQRKVNGQLPLFWSPEGTPGDGYTGGDGAGSFGGGGSGGGNSTPYVWPGNKPNKTTVKGGVTIKEYCQQYNAVQVNTTTGQNYTGEWRVLWCCCRLRVSQMLTIQSIPTSGVGLQRVVVACA